MSQPAIEAPIVSTYDPKGVNQATKSLTGLEKAFKKFGLARKLSFAALTTLAVKYGREAVKAAAADEAAQRKLGATLKNLGKQYAATSVTMFIKQLEESTGVSKDKLRPEMEKLLLVTQTVGEAQDLLNTALNISAGSSYSLQQVTTALAKAQTSNFTALSKMTLGLDSATLESKNLFVIQQELNRLFAGQATKANQGLAADMNKIRIAANNAKEEIGKGLTKSIEAFIEGAGGVRNVTTSMDNYANSVSIALSSTQRLSRTLGTILNAPTGILPNLALDLATGISQAFGGNIKPAGFGAETTSEDRRMFNRVQNQKYLLALKQKELDTATKLGKKDKENAYTKKLNQMFDNDLVSINAALQNKISDDVRARLEALRATKTQDTNDDKDAVMKQIELEKQRADKAIAGWQAQATAAEESYRKQYEAWLDLVAKIGAKPIKQYVEYIDSSGRTITTPKDFGMGGNVVSENPAGTQPQYTPPPVPTMTPNYNISDVVGSIPVAGVGQTVNVEVAVNGFVGNEQQLAEEIARKLQLAQKLGYSTSIVGIS